jgi:tripartite-type tricarboxylate transporter receptor subunit TctC
VKDLVARAKQHPGELTYGSAGVGSGMHITGVQFDLSADIKTVHVAYKGGPEALTDLIAGRTSYVFAPIGLAIPFVKDKRLLALGVTPATRSPALPEVPTIAEAGVPGFEFDTWYGLFAPGALPRPLLEQISADVRRALASADVRERFATRGAVPKPSTPEEFGRFVRAEIDKLGKLIRAAGVTPN